MNALLLVLALLGSPTGLELPIRWTPPGEVAVIVLDRTNLKPVPGVTVTLAPSIPATPPRILATDSSGLARFDGVAPGDHTLTFELSGFARMQVGPFRVGDETTNPRIPEFVAVLNPVMWVDGIHVEK